MTSAKPETRNEKASNKESPDPLFWLLTILIVFCIGVFITGLVKHLQINRPETKWLSLLFALPLILQLIGAAVLYKKLGEDPSVKEHLWFFFWFYKIWMLLCLASYPTLWIFYCFGWYGNLSLLSFFLVIILLLPVAGMTYRIMNPLIDANGSANKGPMRKLWHNCILLKGMKGSVLRYPYWALLFFFTHFLVINYLLGFAFAFHDKEVRADFEKPDSNKLPALYMEKLYPSDAAEQLAYIKKQRSLSNGEDGFADLEKTGPQFRFYFDSNSAHLKPSTISLENRGYKRKLSPKELDNLKWREAKNSENLKDLKEAIVESTKYGESIRLDLIGLADDNQSTGGYYPSNYELSQARAHNLQAFILEQLSDNRARNIEWHCVALSNELPLRAIPPEQGFIKSLFDKLMGDLDIPLDVRVQLNRFSELEMLVKEKKLSQEDVYYLSKRMWKIWNKTEKNRDDKIKDLIHEMVGTIEYASNVEEAAKKRIVKVSLVHLLPVPLVPLEKYEELSLLDCVYFAITGPGGDITPTTKYAKFLCSLSTILQIFFLVVFFNALLTLKGDTPPPNDGKDHQPTGGQGPQDPARREQATQFEGAATATGQVLGENTPTYHQNKSDVKPSANSPPESQSAQPSTRPDAGKLLTSGEQSSNRTALTVRQPSSIQPSGSEKDKA